jgi:hypothetical protein
VAGKAAAEAVEKEVEKVAVAEKPSAEAAEKEAEKVAAAEKPAAEAAGTEKIATEKQAGASSSVNEKGCSDGNSEQSSSSSSSSSSGSEEEGEVEINEEDESVVLEEGEVFTLPLLQLNNEGKEEEQVEGKDVEQTGKEVAEKVAEVDQIATGSSSSQRRREMLPRKVKDPSIYVARTMVKDAEDDGSTYEINDEDDEEEPEENVKRSRKKPRLATAAAASTSLPGNEGNSGNFPPFQSLDGSGEEVSHNMPRNMCCDMFAF